jgi:putative selenium metabolism protein SsnA
MLVVHGNLVTWTTPNQVLQDHALYIENGIIRQIGPSAQLIRAYADPSPLDAGGKFILPGAICGHTHFYGAFARGLAIPGAPPRDFPEILRKLWWPLDRSLTQDDLRYSALVCLVDAVRHGTTTLFDHHASPNAIDGSLDLLAEAVEKAGVRAALCYEVSDRDGPRKAKAGIAENVRFLRRLADQPHPRLAAMFGLHASLTLSDPTLEACRRELPSEAGFHVHAAEADADQVDSISKSGLRVIARLERHGLLGPRSLLAHCVQVDAAEIEILARTRTWVSHQPRSNMNNGVGAAPVEEMLKAGVRVGLGNDGFSNAMWEEWKAAYLLQKVWHRDPRRMSGLEVAEMAVRHNADLASQFFTDAPIGVLAPGAAADLVIVDYHPFTPLEAENVPWHVLFGFRESMITTTIAAGKVLMQDRQLLTLDEEQITARARELAGRAWQRYRGNVS